jgi:hypothetical protein
MARVVASSLLAPILTSKASRLAILGGSSHLIWLSIDGQAITIQSVSPRNHLALPTSIFLSATTDLVADQISLREGRLAFGDQPVQVTRWWRPARAPIASSDTSFTDAPQVDRLLGRGRGLTPEGDDILAGWLVMARSIGHPSFETVRAEVARTAKAKTTTFSACLLDHAGTGYGVSPLIDYVNARLQNSTSVLAKRDLLGRVGDTSGEALAIGVDLAFGLVSAELPSIKFSNQERAIA